ncbi:hypothetical protein ADIS_1860 [Lunatimonas lonarensis]|uniref:Secretion system C-terminal sorting domain-containing protein n=1 Tax=Lunatimonas lonarensis TaxID=1232681 RepID=R7ZU17_9BACT|nr:hypothetical protein [Lunatimonas lonarensis]EON77641.1 hypothetical protein ADIS_1860 [Lunatimonas lonarensis]
MKVLIVNFATLFCLLFIGASQEGFAGAAANEDPDNILTPVDKDGRYARLDVTTLPMDTPVAVRVRDSSQRLVYEFDVVNKGQRAVLVNFNHLKPGIYSVTIIREEDDVVRKNLTLYWYEITVNSVVVLEEDRGQEGHWPLFAIPQ